MGYFNFLLKSIKHQPIQFVFFLAQNLNAAKGHKNTYTKWRSNSAWQFQKRQKKTETLWEKGTVELRATTKHSPRKEPRRKIQSVFQCQGFLQKRVIAEIRFANHEDADAEHLSTRPDAAENALANDRIYPIGASVGNVRTRHKNIQKQRFKTQLTSRYHKNQRHVVV